MLHLLWTMMVLGAALVSHLGTELERKRSLALSFLPCEHCVGRLQCATPARLVCFSSRWVERGNEEVLRSCCAACLNVEERPAEAIAQDHSS